MRDDRRSCGGIQIRYAERLLPQSLCELEVHGKVLVL